MAKDKKGTKAAAPAKSETVKSGRVTKPAEAPSKVSKATAKTTAKAVEKKSKKADDSDDDSSSEEESDDEVQNPAAKTNGVNGAAKAADNDDSDDDSDDSDSDEDVKKPAANKDDGSDDDSSDEEDDDEEEEKPQAEEAPSKKRKADTNAQATPKRAKVMVNGEEKVPTANLFVGNLSWNVDEEWLTREFEGFGELAGVRIITDRDSGRSKGYGYVEFADVDSAIAAQEAMVEKMLDDRPLRVDFSEPRGARQNDGTPQQRSFDRAERFGDRKNEPSTTLFVGNVSFEADESALTDAFQSYGTIKAVRLPTDRESGQLKGFGYVEMSSIDEAKAALEACQGMDLFGRPIRLDFAGAKPDDGGRGGGRGGGGFGGGRGGRGRGGGRDFGGRGGGRGGGRDFGGRGGGRGGFGGRGGKPPSTNRGGFGDFAGKKTSF